MKLTRSNWLLKWAFLGESLPYRNTTLCALFWRIVLFTPMKLIVAGSLVGLLLIFPWFDLGWKAIFLYLGVAGFFGVDALVGYAGFIGEAVKGIKEKYCPLIQIEDED